MLRNAKGIRNCMMRARDGEVGDVSDLYFDDHEWKLRYFVVDAGTWLKSRRVLISPEAVRDPAWDEQVLPVDLTKDQVRRSPPVNADRPVERQHELELRQYYGWLPYWGAPYGVGAMPAPAPAAGMMPVEEKPGDPHLRSANTVMGYRISASDGDIGHVEDLLFDDSQWTIPYLVLDTRNWLPGRKVLISPWWVAGFDWQLGRANVDMTRESIKSSPQYDPSKAVSVEYARELHDYYGRPRNPNWVDIHTVR